MAFRKMEVQEQWQTALSQNASGYVLKAYQVGATTNPVSIALDPMGVITVATVTLNADGFPEVSGNEVVLYIDQDFTYAIYENAADAAANTNAFFGPVDIYDTISTAVSDAPTFLDEFDDLYLGVKASDPAVDNDGDPLIEGALYWSSSTEEMRVYDGTFFQPIIVLDNLSLSDSGFYFPGIDYTGDFINTIEAWCIEFDTTGTKMFVGAYFVGVPRIDQYNLSTANDPSTAVLAGSYDITPEAGAQSEPLGIQFNSDGTRMFVLTDRASPSSQQRVWQYNLSTGFDITTVTYSGNFISVNAQTNQPFALLFAPDGSRFLVTSVDTFYEYTLTAFDLSTAVYSGNSSFASGGSLRGIRFNSDGTKIISASGTPQVFQEHVLVTPYDITTRAFSGYYDVISDFWNLRDFAIVNNGQEMITCNASTLVGTFQFTICNYSSNVVYAD